MTDAPAEPVFEPPAEPRRMSGSRLAALIVTGVIVVAALVLIAIPVASSIADAQPQTYTSADYGYSVHFPAKPQTINSDSTSEFVRWTGDNKSLSAQAHTLTAAEKAQEADTLLRAALTRAASALGGKVTSAIAPTTLGGESGFVVTFSIGGSDRVREAAVIHAGRFYAFTLLNPSSSESSTFLRSLKFSS